MVRGARRNRWIERMLADLEQSRRDEPGYDDLVNHVKGIGGPRRTGKLIRWAQGGLGLTVLLLVLRVTLNLDVLEVAINVLALSATAAIAIAAYDRVMRRPRRPRKVRPIPLPGEHVYRAYAGIGVIFALILSIPAVLFAVLLFLSLLAYTSNFEVAAAGGWLFFIGWLGFCLYSFVPVTLLVGQAGVRSWFSRIHTEAPIISWSQYKARHLVGPVFYVPPLWALPLSWFVVRQSHGFRQHLMERGRHAVP
jgi:hypothetical protein